MHPNDPRHGTYAGAVAHYLNSDPLCRPCKDAAATYRRNRRTRLYLARTDSLMVPAIGTNRRVEALAALGHTMADMDDALGRTRGYTSMRLRRYKTAIRRDIAEEYAELYRRLCMIRPEGPVAERQRRAAARKEYAPPLAWDDIDNPDERPTGVGHDNPTRDEHVADLDARGAGHHDVLRALNISRTTFEKWCHRRGPEGRALLARLKDRDNPHRNRNQHTRSDAA